MQSPEHRGGRLRRCCGRGLLNRFVLDETTGCWNWMGVITRTGYGQIKYHCRPVQVHRLAAHLWLRFPMDDPRCVCHKCDNRRCLNPKHLFIGTHSDNVMDSVRKGRHRSTRKTHCPQGHAYSSTNTWLDPKRNNARKCRICNKENQQRLRDARKRGLLSQH